MSGRSIGCDEYPGGWKTTDLTTGELRPREAVLRSIWETDVEKFGQVLRRWNDNYIRSYHALASAIPGPKMLLWVSPRGPGEWSAELATQTGNFWHVSATGRRRYICANFTAVRSVGRSCPRSFRHAIFKSFQGLALSICRADGRAQFVE